MFGSGNQVLGDEENSNELESIIKIEPERLENDYIHGIDVRINREYDLWPRVVLAE